MTEATWIALMTEAGLTRQEAVFWMLQDYPFTNANLTADDVRELGRKLLPAMKTLRKLQHARGL